LSEISEKVKVRLLGGDAPVRAGSPTPGRLAQSDATSSPPAAAAPKSASPVFLSDSAEGADVLDVAAIVQPLAQLCVSEQVQTPFLAAIAGDPGAGKSFALKRLAQAIETFSGKPGTLGRVIVASVDASDGAEAPVALASAAYAALDCEPGGVDYSSLLDESTHAGGDPLRTAKAASDRHDEIIHKLEAERAQRDEVESRAARLSDALLFETPGSRVDVFARARRGAIDARLRRFGLAGSDAGASYRDLVRDMGTMGPSGRAGIALRSIWAYAGQRRLLLWAIGFFILGAAVSFVHGEVALSAARGAAAQVAPAADWTAAHGAWFETASKVLYVLGALALLLNLWRAVTFSSLLLRGAQLLNLDLRDRRRDLDNRLARLNQRVVALSAEAEAAAKRAEAAARRAGAKAASRAPGPDFLDARHFPSATARAFLSALAERLDKGAGAGAPNRLVYVIDNLDSLPASAAIAWIETAQSVVGAASIGVLALDPVRLVEPLGGLREARRRLEKWLQVVVNLPRRADLDGERIVAKLLATDGHPTPRLELESALVEPLSTTEAALLTALAPLAAHSPRAAKRFLNAYRLARCSSAPRPVVALMQAVAFADDDVRAAMHGRLVGGTGELGDFDGPEVLVKAVKSARAANSGAISIADAHAAEAIARRYALSV